MNEQINNVGDFFGNLLSSIAHAIPAILGAAIILVVGYFIAKGLCKVVDGLLDKARLDERLHSGQGGSMLQKAVPYPSDLVAKIVFWLIFLFAISAAVGSLGVPILTTVIAAIYAYIPKVIAATLIFLVAGTVAGGVAGLVQKTMGDTPTGKVISTTAPIVIMSIAGFMILNQLMIAPAIVTITYAVLLGSAGLGLALAFGLGGREVAGRMLNTAYDKSQAAQNRVRADIEVGKQNAKKEAKKARTKVVPTDNSAAKRAAVVRSQQVRRVKLR